jgi:hypothetical protein
VDLSEATQLHEITERIETTLLRIKALIASLRSEGFLDEVDRLSQATDHVAFKLGQIVDLARELPSADDLFP